MSSLVNISEAASLGLHAMALLAQYSQRRFTNQEIADVLEGSSHHLAKVTQRLVKAGLISSIRGPQGGFQLQRPAELISLLEIYETIEGPVDMSACASGRACASQSESCREVSCVLGRTIRAARDRLCDCLANITLTELAENTGFSAPPGGQESNT